MRMFQEDILAIKRTLRDLRDVRRVCEKTRLLGEQVKKREKLKREWHQMCEREFTLCATSLHLILTQIIAQLKEFDTQAFFSAPVDTKAVSSLIKNLRHSPALVIHKIF